MNGTVDLAKRTGLTIRLIDRWIANRYIWIEDESNGSGHVRTFTDDEAADLVTLARIYFEAREAGMNLNGDTVARIWDALQRGKMWHLYLTTDTR